MAKVKVSLLVLILVLSMGSFYIWENWNPKKHGAGYAIDTTVKLLVVGTIVVIFLLPAIVLFISSFSVFNEAGQLKRNSLLYGLLEGFYGTEKEETESGEIIEISRVSDEVHFCPSYWMLVLLFGFTYLVFVLIGFLIMVGSGIATTGFGPMPEITANSLRNGGIVFGVSFIGGIVLVFVVASVAALLVKIFPWFKKSFLGLLISAVYDKACIKLQVEPISVEK